MMIKMLTRVQNIFLATKNIEETLETVRVKIVEKNKLRAEYLASQLNDAIIINGDGLDETLVERTLKGLSQSGLAKILTGLADMLEADDS